MIEKVNPSHPDKVADRIAGAIVDLAYKKVENPRIAVEVLIGHGNCYIVAETSVHMTNTEIREIIDKITMGIDDFDYIEAPQDAHLAENQSKTFRCGDNGIFKGVPLNDEEKELGAVIRRMYDFYPTDGKFIYDKASGTFIACQSNAESDDIYHFISDDPIDCDTIIVNPLGDWTGGTDVDTGATNRKLGSDMGRAVTGGGLHGKDLSKADVSVNIVAHILAQTWGEEVEALCAIGDEGVCFNSKNHSSPMNYNFIMLQAKKYITNLGGFEKLAEWGLF